MGRIDDTYSTCESDDEIELFLKFLMPEINNISIPDIEIIQPVQPANTCDSVMLDYILEKNHIDIDEITDGEYAGMYEITDYKIVDQNNDFKKINYIFDFAETQIINGHYIVDRHELMDLYDLSVEEACHNPGDYFNSIEDAALAFRLTYLQESLDNDIEYIAFIYIDSDTFIEYDGFHITPIIKYFFGEVSTDGLTEINDGYTVAGWVHTYGNHEDYICNSCFYVYPD